MQQYNMVYIKKCPRRIAENSNCFTTKYDNVKEKPVMTRSMINITHLGTGLENDRNCFMLQINMFTMWLFRTRIFQELKGITMSENKGWSRRNGYYAGNMDPGLMNAQKMDCK
jgi:hypothetical protein